MTKYRIQFCEVYHADVDAETMNDVAKMFKHGDLPEDKKILDEVFMNSLEEIED
jgi:hypothetical protein